MFSLPDDLVSRFGSTCAVVDAVGELAQPLGAAADRIAQDGWSSAVRTSTSRSMPRSRSRAAVTGPTPQSASTGSCLKEVLDRSGAITVSPSGFFHADAIFARNLFGATPADAVSPVASRISALSGARRRAERLAPRVLGDVEIRLVERERLDERRDRAEDLEDRLRRRAVLLEVAAGR